MSTGHITKEIAEKFLKDESGVNLREATSIDDDAAEALSKYQGIELWLDGLTALSHDAEWMLGNQTAKVKIALELGQRLNVDFPFCQVIKTGDAERYVSGGNAWLSEATDIDDDAAEILGLSAVERDDHLNLSGLQYISEPTAKSLTGFSGHLKLGLHEISEPVASALSQHKGSLDLDCLVSPSDEILVALTGNTGGSMSLYGVKSLSDEAAKSLAKHKGDLALDGLTELSDTAAKYLSNHAGRLSFRSLKHLSVSAAEALAEHRGDLELYRIENLQNTDLAKKLADSEGFRTCAKDYLSLDQVMMITDSAAEALAGFRGSISLNGLRELSDVSAEMLSKHQGSHLTLGVEELSETSAKYLSQYRGSELYLRSLEFLSKTAASNLLDKRELYFDITSDCFLAETESRATIISNIHLRVLAEQIIDKNVANAYMECKRAARLHGHKANVKISCALTITDGAAKILIKDDCLELPGLNSISDTTAKVFSTHKGTLALDGITELSDTAAQFLAKHKGELSLKGLNRISDTGVEFLSASPGRSSLSLGLKKLSESTAKSLSKHRGGLFLDSLKSLPANLATMLTGHVGSLSLNGLSELEDAAVAALTKRKGTGFLSLKGLKTLTEASAQTLAKAKGDLHFEALTELSDAAAQSLAQHKRRINCEDPAKWADSMRKS